jgi:hypothetical protein
MKGLGPRSRDLGPWHSLNRHIGRPAPLDKRAWFLGRGLGLFRTSAGKDSRNPNAGNVGCPPFHRPFTDF